MFTAGMDRCPAYPRLPTLFLRRDSKRGSKDSEDSKVSLSTAHTMAMAEGPFATETFATETTVCVAALPNIHPTTLCSGVPCALLDSAKNLEVLETE